MNSGDDNIAGSMTNAMSAINPERINFSLFLLKKKNASPTMPYNLIKVPRAIAIADFTSFPLCRYEKLIIIRPVRPTLNWKLSMATKAS